jgi:hypothetical protein
VLQFLVADCLLGRVSVGSVWLERIELGVWVNDQPGMDSTNPEPSIKDSKEDSELNIYEYVDQTFGLLNIQIANGDKASRQ